MQHQYLSNKPFELESGNTISPLKLTYHTFGERKEDDSNIIWVFHALTANSDVSEWWPELFGKNNILDPDNYFIICVNVIGSPYGSSAPDDLSFPLFSIRDQCQAHILLARELNIDQIFLCIGGSFGGDQALEFAYSYPCQIERLILIASCAKESAWAIAVHETQRLALESDPTFGTPNGGLEGIKAARAIGMLTYRTSKLYIDRQTDHEDKLDDFQASSYIRYQGQKFADRFTALSYFYLTKCLDSHDIGRNRGGVQAALSQIHTRTLVISIESDMLIPPALQEEIYSGLPNAQYHSIASDAGHDGFLIEGEKLRQVISPFIKKEDAPRIVHKFGGKSLANGRPIRQVIEIIKKHKAEGNPMAVIVSARGSSTDHLLEIYQKAVNGRDFENDLKTFIDYQSNNTGIDLTELSGELSRIVQSASVLQVPHEHIENKIVAFGELLSASLIAQVLQSEHIAAETVDSRRIIKMTFERGSHQVDFTKSRKRTRQLFEELDDQTIPIITGFIAEDSAGLTTNLGRNGSNYSASLIASFIQAKAVYNWTDVDGIYSANPKFVKNAKLIQHLSFREANEMANFGTNVLHSKTILPLLESRIPLYIKNSHRSELPGTKIDYSGSGKGIKSVTAIDDVSLISIEGSGLLGQVGIDSRIFTCLQQNQISVRLISQASTERGIGFVIDRSQSDLAIRALHEEFTDEIHTRAISSIKAREEIAIIAITGRHNYALEKAIQGLRKEKIWIYLFSNSINGENISLVISKQHMLTALNIVHDFVV